MKDVGTGDLEFAADKRVGMYVMPETRNRINEVKSVVNGTIGRRRHDYTGKVSQDEIINIALDLLPDLAARIIHSRRLAEGGES